LMPKVVVVTGFKNTGKTRLIEALITELGSRGFRVGVVKHTLKPYRVDTPGKDTWRYREAGAQVSALLTPNDSGLFLHQPLELNEAVRLLGSLDFVLLEGFKELDRAPRIVVAQTLEEVEQLKNGLEVAIAGKIAGSGLTGLGAPVLDPDMVTILADLVEEKAMPLLPGLNCGRCSYSSCKELARAVLADEAEVTKCVNLSSEETQVFLDGMPLAVNPFVGKVIKNVVMGIVSTLKGAGSPKSVELRFKVDKEPSEGGEEP